MPIHTFRVINACRVGVLSTNSSGEATQGYPSGMGLPGSIASLDMILKSQSFCALGSIVEYAADEAGWPLFAFSSMSAHTSDVRRDGRISLTVTAPGFQVCITHYIDQYYKQTSACMLSSNIYSILYIFLYSCTWR